MTNIFEVCCEKLELEQLEQKKNKPDMVDSIADKLLEDHMALMAENKLLKDEIGRLTALLPNVKLAELATKFEKS